ncbi:MAG: Ty1/Copia family ribonuclease HI [bacterium]
MKTGSSGRGGRFPGRNPGRGNFAGRASYSGSVFHRKQTEEKEYKFHPLGRDTSKNKATFQETFNKLVNKLRMTISQDVADAIQDMKEFEFDAVRPKLEMSREEEDDQKRAAEQAQLDKFYQYELQEWGKRKRKYEEQKGKTFAIIFETFCTDSMRDRLESLPNFSTEVDKKPLKLLEEIKKIMMTPQTAIYPAMSILSTMRGLINLRQRQDEDMKTYYERFRQQMGLWEQMIGSSFLDAYVENTEEFQKVKEEGKPEKEILSKKEAYEAFMTLIFMDCSDQASYGAMMQDFRQRYANNQDLYPKNIQKAREVMEQHKKTNRMKNVGNDRRGSEQQNRGAERPRNQGDGDEPELPVQTSFAQQRYGGRRCFRCGSRAHLSIDPTCSRNEKPRDQWWDRTGQEVSNAQAQQHQQNTDDSSVTIDNTVQSHRSGANSTGDGLGWHSRRERRSFQGFQVCSFSSMDQTEPQKTVITKTGAHLKDVLLLDSGTTKSMICNEDFIYSIQESQNPMIMETNGGTKIVRHEGFMPSFGKIGYDKDLIANILGLSDLIKVNRVTYDSSIEDAFLVHINDNDFVKFKNNGDGLYLYKPAQEFKDEVAQRKKNESGACRSVEVNSLVQTVAANEMGFSKHQIEKAKVAIKSQFAGGAPTFEAFKKLVNRGEIKGSPVKLDDLKIANEIYLQEKAVSMLKGKTKRSTPPAVVEDRVEIPGQLMSKIRILDLCIDVMFVNSCIFLTSIDKTIRFRAVVPLKERALEELEMGVRKVVKKYNDNGYFVKMIHADSEFGGLIDTIVDDLEGVTLNLANPDDHVPEAERNNQTLKERTRVGFHRLPYKMLPKLLIQALVCRSAATLNYYTPTSKLGASREFSPHKLVQQTHLHHWMFAHETGEYVQVQQTNNPTNSMMARTKDCLYLYPGNGVQESHYVLDLQTKKRIKRRTVIGPIPITDTVIQLVEKIAAEDGQEKFKGLKFFDRKKREMILPDTDQIPGVSWEDVFNEEFADYQEKDDDLLGDDDEDLNEDEYDPVDENEIEDLNAEYDEDDEDEDNETNLDRSQAENEEADDEEEDDSRPVDDQENEAEAEMEEEQPAIEDEEKEEERQENESENEEEKEVEDSATRRSGRHRSVPGKFQDYVLHSKEQRYLRAAKKGMERDKRVTFADDLREKEIELERCHSLFSQAIDDDRRVKYEEWMVPVIAHFITHIRDGVTVNGFSFAQQYGYKTGIKLFGKKGKEAANKEMDQLYRRTCFEPILVKDLDPIERKRALSSFLFMTMKDSGEIKARFVANGKSQRDYMSGEDTASPTCLTESLLLTATIDAHEERDVMVADVPNAFIQADMPEAEKGKRVILKIIGPLVDELVRCDHKKFSEFVVMENGHKVLYLIVLKALYGMLDASLRWYVKFRGDLETIGFKFNFYDPCVANRNLVGAQQTIRFHVDDIMSSHVAQKVNDKFLKWLNKSYGKIKPVTASRGKIHKYLGMTLDFTEKGKLKIRMDDYVERMIKEFPVQLKSTDTAMSPAANDVFELGKGKELEKKQKEVFHSTVAKGIFLSKRARPDIHQAIAVLSTRVKEPNESDWNKLVRMMKYLNSTKKLHLTLSIDDLRVLKWYVDAAFAVHPDFKSHSGLVMTWGKGALISSSSKQKLNTRSSTEAELVGVDDKIGYVLWTKLFLEEQGYEIEKNILYQDNKSAILLELNGRKSAGKRSRCLNIRFFFIHDQVEKGNVQIEHCGTDDMLGDFNTKATQGARFRRFRDKILGR